MCFFIQSCEPFEKEKPQKKSTKKKAHHSFMSLVSYLPPLPPPLHTSQLTETWQWPTCMCWPPKLTLLFGGKSQTGQSPAPYLCSTLEILLDSALPCALEQGLSLSGMQEPAHVLCAHPDSKCRAPPGPPFSRWNPLPPIPVGVVKALLGWAVTWFSSNCKRTQPSAAWWDPPFPAPTHTCRLATAAFCDSALFSRSRCSCV